MKHNKIILKFICLSLFFYFLNLNVWALEIKIVDISNCSLYFSEKRGICHNIFILDNGIDKKFFKECKVRLNPFETVKRAIDEYLNDSYFQEKESILSCFSNENNLNKFLRMKTYGDGIAAKWLKSDKSDTSCLGITCKLPLEFRMNVLPGLVNYAFSEFVQYFANKSRELGQVQDVQILNNIATLRVAKLLGLENLIVNTEYVNLIKDGEIIKTGILMDHARGVSVWDFKKNPDRCISPKFQMAMSNLMILDSICAQRDREIPNYFVDLSENGNEVIGVNAFDNDMSFNEFVDLKKSNYDICAMITRDDKISLPHMDRTLAEKILNIEENQLEDVLSDVLEDWKIKATKYRFSQIKTAIKNTTDSNKNFLIEIQDWDSNTLSEEINGNYGYTYLKRFCNRIKLI